MKEQNKILFVCVENSFRSQIAEAFARMHGGDRIEVYSAGSKPSRQVNPKAIATMKEIGYDLAAHSSKSLSEIPDVEYDVAVTMGCGDECYVGTRPSTRKAGPRARQDAPLPVVRAKRRESWEIPDPKNLAPEEVTAIRDLINRHVRVLIEHELNTA